MMVYAITDIKKENRDCAYLSSNYPPLGRKPKDSTKYYTLNSSNLKQRTFLSSDMHAMITSPIPTAWAKDRSAIKPICLTLL